MSAPPPAVSVLAEAQPTPGPVRARFPVSRILTIALLWLIGALLVEVLFEGWVQIRFGTRTTGPNGVVTVDPLDWPKTVKSALYLVLAGLALVKIAIDRRWRELRTGADAAVIVLGLVLLLAGLVNGSSIQLIGEALFVYLRGAIVFYALRAAAPTWLQLRPMLAVVAGVLGLNVLIALAETVIGRPLYVALGWVDLKWADTNRAHALLDHPNHLGHVLGLALLGVVGWIATHDRVPRRWWLLLLAGALALAASQSRESLVAFTVGAVLIWVLARGVAQRSGRKVIAAVLVVGLCAVGQVAARPSNWAEWERRIEGVFAAFRVPSGTEPTPAPTRTTPGPPATPGPSATASPAPDPTHQAKPATVPAREWRVLYYQQGARLWERRPLLGYGVGQFGGIVAQQHDPNWADNPKFGPTGFNRYGANSLQIDSFWLHLLVETGALGTLSYLAWLLLLLWPLLRVLPGLRRLRPNVGRHSRERPPHVLLALWATAALVFVALVAFLSPSLEDPLLPPLLFAVIGLAWVLRTGPPPRPVHLPADTVVGPQPGASDAGGPATHDGTGTT